MPNLVEIEQIAQNRGIKFLIHFTKLKNLDSICQYGLRTRENLERYLFSVQWNDKLRLDEKKNSISCSIDFPNDKMFSAVRKRYPHQKWMIVKLNTSILWKKQCLFNSTNAANSNMKKLSEAQREGPEAFKRLFSNGNTKSLSSLPDNYPLDSQAEILVMEDIEQGYIESLILPNQNLLEPLKNQYRCFKFECNEELFSHRST